jgi:cytochrome c biogenesis protein CcdA
VAIVELPCTGAVYLAVLALMANSGLSLSNFTMLIIYNLLFITPLIIILILFYRGMKSEVIDGYIKKYKPYMRLLTGLLLLGMAAWMFVFTYV